jgi:hypothetical protein
MFQKSLFASLASLYVSSRLKRAFFDLRVLNLESLRVRLSKGPLIFASNHVCWWDPLILIQLQRALKFEGYCLMSRGGLHELPFFSGLGALPIAVDDPRLALIDLRSAALKLDGPHSVLAIFPHGAQRPAHLPLEFRSGVYVLAKIAGVPVVPMSLRYDFWESPRPVVHIRFGESMSVDEASSSRVFLRALEDQVRTGFSEIDACMTEPEEGCVLRTPISILGRSPRSLRAERIPGAAHLLGAPNGERGPRS